MIDNIEFEITPVEDAADAINDWIINYFFKDLPKDFIDTQIEVKISNYIEEFKEDLYCLIEYPYVDKVYRDSYYSYYSTKHYTYQRDSIRVSIFRNRINKSDFINPKNHNKLRKNYLGFFIIRPITNAIIGRSNINPEAFENDKFKICRNKNNALIFGVKLESEGFPHSSQDGETISCAETTIWAIMDYFGNKYPDYKPELPAKIRKSLERFSYQRQLPSTGLTMDQISFALKEFGFGTRIYSESSYKKEVFKIIDCYIESGIPVLAGLENEEMGHVMIIIGKKYEENIDWTKINLNEYKGHGRVIKYYDTSDFGDNYVIQDDNLAPYRLITLEKPGENYDDGSDEKDYKIDSIVVPLYPKIYLEAVLARELLIQILKDELLGYDFADGFILRTFLASSRSFKSHITNLSKMNNQLKYNILATRMPKFIWCGEIYEQSNYIREEKEAIGLVILDATEANKIGIDAFIFGGYPDRCVSMCENSFNDLNNQLKEYYYFCNLK